MKTLDLFNSKIKIGFLKYSLGLILTEGKRSCPKMAAALSICYDYIYRFLLKASSFLPLFPSIMISIVKRHATGKNRGYLIIDETFFAKQFAGLLEGIFNMFNAAMGRQERGVLLVVMAWSNGVATIPIAFKWMFHKDLVGKNHKTKSELAKELLLEYKNKIPFDYLLIDGHYSTIYLMRFLVEQEVRFVAKFPVNRVIVANGEQNQLRDHSQLKLLRNCRSRSTKATFNDMNLYISAHKRKKRNGEFAFTYIVSNICLQTKEYLQRYEQRWKIEIMFRTMKQSLGLQHCQARSLERQGAHIYAIFFSYSFLQNEKAKLNLKNSEQTARALGQLKLDETMSRITRFGDNFDYVA